MFVLCLVLLIIYHEAETRLYDNPDIGLNVLHGSNSNIFKYTVVKDQPLNIVLEGANTTLNCCMYGKPNRHQTITNMYTINYNSSILHVPKVIDEMSSIWKCHWFQEIRSDKLNQFIALAKSTPLFVVHVKGAKSVKFTINGQNLTFVRTDLSVKECDGEANYSYVDGEVVDLVCDRLQNNKGRMRLRHYDAHGKLLDETYGAYNPHKLRIILDSENNNSYIDCIYISESMESYILHDEYIYRTTFILYSPRLDEILPEAYYESNLILIIAVVAVLLILFGVMICVIRCCCKSCKTQETNPTNNDVRKRTRCDTRIQLLNKPKNVFYQNLLFRRECQQEIEAQEHHYEEISSN